jgi:hypothetical protein
MTSKTLLLIWKEKGTLSKVCPLSLGKNKISSHWSTAITNFIIMCTIQLAN